MQLSYIATAAAAFASLMTVSTASRATTFDFETIADGTYSSASQTVGGLTATFTDSGGGSIEIYDLENTVPGLSNNTLIDYGSGNFGTGMGPVNANFSSAVSDVSITGGDLGNDVDHITLAAFSGLNGTGTLLGNIVGPDCCSGSNPGSETVTLDVAGVRSIQFYSSYSDEFPGSVFFDNLSVGASSSAPEPSTWALMIAGVGSIGMVLRRAKQSAGFQF